MSTSCTASASVQVTAATAAIRRDSVQAAPTGRTLEIWTDRPSMQVFTGTGLDEDTPGLAGVPYPNRGGVALEAQGFPNAANRPDYPSTRIDADHPLVPLLRPDWGDPLADPAAYDCIAAISPCDNVRPAPYPPLLCTAGLKDDRVPYWEPAKLIAQVRDQSTSQQPAVLLLDPDSGHQGSDDQHSEHAQAALLWAFARRCVGAGLEG